MLGEPGIELGVEQPDLGPGPVGVIGGGQVGLEAQGCQRGRGRAQLARAVRGALRFGGQLVCVGDGAEEQRSAAVAPACTLQRGEAVRGVRGGGGRRLLARQHA